MIRVLCVIVGYCFGMIQTAFILGKLKGIDIREHGSGNSGTTNALRVMGKKAGAICFVMDAVKAIVPMVAVYFLFRNGTYAQIEPLLRMYVGVGVVLGHNFPFYMGFKGGKGVLVGVSVFLVIDWRVFCILIGVFAIVLILSKYVSLSSMIAAGCCPIVTFLMQHFRAEPLPLWYQLVNTAMAALMGGWVIFMHRSNMERLKNGTENLL